MKLSVHSWMCVPFGKVNLICVAVICYSSLWKNWIFPSLYSVWNIWCILTCSKFWATINQKKKKKYAIFLNQAGTQEEEPNLSSFVYMFKSSNKSIEEYINIYNTKLFSFELSYNTFSYLYLVLLIFAYFSIDLV